MMLALLLGLVAFQWCPEFTSMDQSTEVIFSRGATIFVLDSGTTIFWIEEGSCVDIE